jgi:hypothetical protein
MQMEHATAHLLAHYESSASTGWCFIEMYRLCLRLTGWPCLLAFCVTAELFPLEFDLYITRLGGSAKPRHADRFSLNFNPEWN